MKRLIILLCFVLGSSLSWAQKKPIAPPTKSPDGPADDTQALSAGVENDYYQLSPVPVPDGILMEVGGLCVLPDGRLAAATRRGDVYIIENPKSAGFKAPNFRLYATGLHEPLGLAYKDGALWCAQRGSLTKLIDTNGDQKADIYENVYTIPISGNYHEYAFGPKFDKKGDAYITLNVGFTNPDWWIGKSLAKWRGWALKVSADGQTVTPIATGLRSPAGLGVLEGDQLFYTENQGDWVGSGGMTHLTAGDIAHNPAGLRWTSESSSPLKVKPEDLKNDGKPLFEHAQDVPNLKQPAVWLPHGILGGSTSDVLPDSTQGNFGPFSGQIFIGDQNQASIARVFLEKVKGVYQGAGFAFRKGFASGVLRLAWDGEGAMYVGSTDRGWKSHGPNPWGLQRLSWTGKVPFEIKEMRAKPDGFELSFTQPVNKTLAANPATWSAYSFIYKHHATYGSPTIREKDLPVRYVQVSEDGLRVRLVVDSLREGYIHQIGSTTLKSEAGIPLLHTEGFYTLIHLPDGDKLSIPAAALQPAKTTPATKASPTKAVTAPKPAKATSSTAPPASGFKASPETIAQGAKFYTLSGCVTCHPAKQMGLGPGVNMIAAKYKADPKAYDKLLPKVMNGGVGVWGNEPMPTQAQVGKEKIQKILSWMLSQ